MKKETRESKLELTTKFLCLDGARHVSIMEIDVAWSSEQYLTATEKAHRLDASKYEPVDSSKIIRLLLKMGDPGKETAYKGGMEEKRQHIRELIAERNQLIIRINELENK